MIGNSHTHVNNVPALLQSLLSWGTGRQVHCKGCSTDSVGLQWHWKQRKSLATLSDGSFDFVVLQERSGGPLEHAEITRTHAGLWCEAIKQKGSVPVLYMTWALAGAPHTQSAIAQVYSDVARSHQARLAPVGLAWQQAGYTQHSPPLYDDDGRHAAPAGSVLAAAVLAQTIAPELPWLELDSDPPALAGLSKEQVANLIGHAGQTMVAQANRAV
jgi:hypothetical protein